MFIVYDDMTVSLNRGDVGVIPVPQSKSGKYGYSIKAGDILRLRVFPKKKCEDVALSKEYLVETLTSIIELELDGTDTKIGDIINKPTTYWYEVELNPDTNPQTIVGYDEDGPKIFMLYPEGNDSGELPSIDTERDVKVSDGAVKSIVKNEIFTEALKDYVGDIEETLDEIIEIQESFIDGEADIENPVSTSDNYGYIFKYFPTEAEIQSLSNHSYFTVRSQGNVNGETTATYYRTTEPNWRANALRYTDADGTTTIYVVPVNQPVGELYMPFYGIKTGIENAESNSEIISFLTQTDGGKGAAYGTTFRFPAGNFYFSEPIDVSGKQISILGATDTNHKNTEKYGVTFLHFTDLEEDETALKAAQCTLENFVILGTSEQYNLNLVRNNAFTDVSTVVQETIGVKAYGIQTTGGMLIRNVGFKYFYYGCSCDNSNMFIDNISFHNCHYGLSLGTDIKVNTISGANVMTLLQLRDSLCSAVGVRGDSIGQHLVEITGGRGHTLVDLDADFCMDAIVSIGDGVNVSNISDLTITGVHGRSGVSHFFKNDADEITANDITSDIVGEFGVIAVKGGSSLNGAYIVTNQSASENNNPFDGTEEGYEAVGYSVPFVLLSAGTATTVKGVQFVTTYYQSEDLTENWLKKRIKSLSTSANSCYVKVQTSKGSLMYLKDENGLESVLDEATDLYKKMDFTAFALNDVVVKSVNGNYPDDEGNVVIEEVEPEVVTYTVDELYTYGDTTKKYVLDDGYIYAYRKRFVAGTTTPNFTNQLPLALNPLTETEVLNGVGYKKDVLYSVDTDQQYILEEETTDGYWSTGLIPVEEGDFVCVNAMGYHTTSGTYFFRALRGDKSAVGSISSENLSIITEGGGNYISTGVYESGKLSDVKIYINDETFGWVTKYDEDVKYVLLAIADTTPPEDVIITVNEEIIYTTTEDKWIWEWVNTGEQYYAVDYLSMINALEERIAKLEESSAG